MNVFIINVCMNIKIELGKKILLFYLKLYSFNH